MIQKPILSLIALSSLATAGDLTGPIVSPDLVFEERDGIVAIEAEHFVAQSHAEKRAWYLTTRVKEPDIQPDGDPSSIAGASGGAYLEILPDTRRTHGDRLIRGENFEDKPGKMAILSYKVHFSTPGKYWIWARAYSTTTEDNGLHFGIDGTWPDTASKWQTVSKNKWDWKSARRTEKVHAGVPGILTLEVPAPGLHTIQVSMREDGIALDKILLANRKEYTPKDLGPDASVKTGAVPAAFEFVKAESPAAAKPAVKAHQEPREPDGDGSIQISGELKQWHNVTLTLDGPFARELDDTPNPFTDYKLDITFTHESGKPSYTIPGYFAADGNAANTSADSGTKWRVHFAPDLTGKWNYKVSFLTARMILMGETDAVGRIQPLNDKTGSFTIGPSDKKLPDFRARGRLAHVGKHHLQFQGDKSFFLKAGADAPETLLAFTGFDNTFARRKNVPLKTWSAHLGDWKPGDPTWQEGKGKGLIGALNYLSGKGMNAFSFLPYNAGGDGDNVWPFVERDDKFHYDCSKLDQWGIVFGHGTQMGLFLHFKLQETENDDRDGPGSAQSLDGGDCGPERKLYLREIIARYGHNLALNWNLGEENTQTTKQQKDMIQWIREMDAYDHPVVLHTFPPQQDKVYRPHLDKDSLLDGLSLQNSNIKDCHHQVVKWTSESTKAGKPWVVSFDEPGDAGFGMPPDDSYANMAQLRKSGKAKGAPTVDDIRKYTLWGTILGGGAGIEYYFGYKLPQNDLVAEDWRSRDKSWDYARIALDFFRDQKIPFQEMTCRDELVGNDKHDNSKYCLAREGELYLVYLPNGGTTPIDLPDEKLTIAWFNPRDGKISPHLPMEENNLTAPDEADWLAVIRRN